VARCAHPQPGPVRARLVAQEGAAAGDAPGGTRSSARGGSPCGQCGSGPLRALDQRRWHRADGVSRLSARRPSQKHRLEGDGASRDAGRALVRQRRACGARARGSATAITSA
jgi:hypothetical protein